jgi:hypothetical protein
MGLKYWTIQSHPKTLNLSPMMKAAGNIFSHTKPDFLSKAKQLSSLLNEAPNYFNRRVSVSSLNILFAQRKTVIPLDTSIEKRRIS